MKRLAAIMLAVSTALFCTSCDLVVKNNDEQYDYPVTVGNLVIEKAPANIAVMSENIADVIIACGYEGKLSARGENCTSEVLEVLPTIGTPDMIDVDKAGDMQVELILTDVRPLDETIQQLEEQGIKLLIIKPASDIESMQKLYNNVASAVVGAYTGRMQAMSVFDEVRAGLEQVKNGTADSNVVSTACYIYDLSDDECVVAYGNDFADKLFEFAGVTNIAAADDDGVIGIDTLLKSNPETIFCNTGVYEKLVGNKDLKSLQALTKGTVYELPEKYLQLQGRTCIMTADYIAAKNHAEYAQMQIWPDEFAEKQQEYKPPFEPKKDIFYEVGETYEPIKAIEERLIGLGYLSGTADETYSQDTAQAVSEFQAANNLAVTGIADYDTLKVLLSAKAVSKSSAVEVTVNPE